MSSPVQMLSSNATPTALPPHRSGWLRGALYVTEAPERLGDCRPVRGDPAADGDRHSNRPRCGRGRLGVEFSRRGRDLSGRAAALYLGTTWSGGWSSGKQ